MKLEERLYSKNYHIRDFSQFQKAKEEKIAPKMDVIFPMRTDEFIKLHYAK